ncbi:hypothetical protein OH76DRAFT_1366894, partial [Lentinus brumalis]
AKLSTKWRSCAYAFFKADVEVVYVDGRRCLEFKCAAKTCRVGKPVRRFLDTKDAASSGNLFKHARQCWGDEALEQARELGDATRVRSTLVANILRTGAITEYFAPARQGAPTYSNRPYTKLEIRYRPFAIATDPGLLRLMKTGRPNIFIPSPRMISRDLKLIFAVRRGRVSKMLVAYPGRLHFATDAWTSPNHWPFVAFTVHLELKGMAFSMLLDLVELSKVRTSHSLATL